MEAGMKRLVILPMIALFLTGCTHYSLMHPEVDRPTRGHMDNNVTGIDGQTPKGIMIKELDDKTRKILEVEDHDLVIATKRNGDRIFYSAEGKSFIKLRDFPFNRKLEGETTIHLISESPGCIIINALGYPEYLQWC